jgi:hypothetical protein
VAPSSSGWLRPRPRSSEPVRDCAAGRALPENTAPATPPESLLSPAVSPRRRPTRKGRNPEVGGPSPPSCHDAPRHAPPTGRLGGSLAARCRDRGGMPRSACRGALPSATRSSNAMSGTIAARRAAGGSRRRAAATSRTCGSELPSASSKVSSRLGYTGGKDRPVPASSLTLQADQRRVWRSASQGEIVVPPVFASQPGVSV